MMNGQCLAADRANTEQKETVNPFVHHLELTTTYEKIKAGILTVVVLPARLLVIACLLVLAWLLACVGLFGLSEADLQQRPLSTWRRGVRWVSGLVLRTMMFVFGFHWVRVTGVKASRLRAPLIVMAPHSTFFDILPAICLGDVCVVTRKENLDFPIVGKLINFTQPVYVRRDDPDSRQNTIKQIIDRATSQQDWSQMLIFPEGTCTNRSCLITFKPGAFYPGVPVQPVILRYPNKLDTVTWTWEGPGALKLMWLTLVQPHSNCEIEFLPVYKPSAAERQDPKLYADNVRQLMARALGVPTMDYTYDDCQLVARANRLGIPRTATVLQMLKMRIRLGLTRSQRETSIVSVQPDQLRQPQPVDLAQFAERLSLPPSDSTVHELYSLLGHDSCGRVDFSEYLLAVLLVDQAHSKQEMLELGFQLGGAAGGLLEERQLATLLRLVEQMSPPQAERAARDICAAVKPPISYSQFESYTKKRPELLSFNNNNSGHDKTD